VLRQSIELAKEGVMKFTTLVMALGLFSFAAYAAGSYHDYMDARGESIEEQEEVIADPEDFPAMEDSGKLVPRERQVHGPDIFEDESGEEEDLERFPEEDYAY